MSDRVAIDRGLSAGPAILLGDAATKSRKWRRVLGGYLVMAGLAGAQTDQLQGRDD